MPGGVDSRLSGNALRLALWRRGVAFPDKLRGVKGIAWMAGWMAWMPALSSHSPPARNFGPHRIRPVLLAIAADTDNTGLRARSGFADLHFVPREAQCAFDENQPAASP